MTMTEQHPESTIAEQGPEIIRFDKAALKEHFGDFVRGTVEETLNALLDAEADELCGAAGSTSRKPRRKRRRRPHDGNKD